MWVGMRDLLGTPSPHLHLTGMRFATKALRLVKMYPRRTAQKGGTHDTTN